MSRDPQAQDWQGKTEEIDRYDWLAGWLCTGCQIFNFPDWMDRIVYISALQCFDVYHHYTY